MKLIADAQTPDQIFGQVTPPTPIANLGYGGIGLTRILSNLIALIFVAATIVFVFMIVQAAFQMITSGGEKEALHKARQRITWAVIGIIFLSLAFVFARVIGSITGFTFVRI